MTDPFDNDLIESLKDHVNQAEVDWEVSRVEFYDSIIRPQSKVEWGTIWFLRLIIVMFFALGIYDLVLHQWFQGALQFVWIVANLFNLRSFIRIRERRKISNAEYEEERQKHLNILAELDPAHELVMSRYVIDEDP